MTDEELLQIEGIGVGSLKLIRERPGLLRSRWPWTKEIIGV